jgi:hypothetical protein
LPVASRRSARRPRVSPPQSNSGLAQGVGNLFQVGDLANLGMPRSWDRACHRLRPERRRGPVDGHGGLRSAMANQLARSVAFPRSPGPPAPSGWSGGREATIIEGDVADPSEIHDGGRDGLIPGSRLFRPSGAASPAPAWTTALKAVGSAEDGSPVPGGPSHRGRRPLRRSIERTPERSRRDLGHVAQRRRGGRTRRVGHQTRPLADAPGQT